jgi:hypothetical protein
LVGSSNLSEGTNFWSVRLSVRTLPFHGGKMGSIPLRTANFCYDFFGVETLK